VGVLEGRAAREPASIVFCFRWVSPHREGTDNAISLAGWGDLWALAPCRGVNALGRGRRGTFSAPCLLWNFCRRITKIECVKKELLCTSHELDRRS